jgi:hypothetical protein
VVETSPKNEARGGSTWDGTDKASDWWSAGRFDVAEALGLAAGKYPFDFYSESADIGTRYLFSGFGSGLGRPGVGMVSARHRRPVE